MRPDGLTTTSRQPVWDEFWTRTVPEAVAAPSELNVNVGFATMRDPFSSRCHPDPSPPAVTTTLLEAHGLAVPEQKRVRLSGFVCDSTVCEVPRVIAYWRAWFSATMIVRAAPSVSCARV
jgi:hypothetical protein